METNFGPRIIGLASIMLDGLDREEIVAESAGLRMETRRLRETGQVPKVSADEVATGEGAVVSEVDVEGSSK